MARKKTPATRVNVKAQISGRLRELRQELFGEHGGPELARRLNLPARTWYNYETGVTVPAEVLLAFIDQTGANPSWLLSGLGPRIGHPSCDPRPLDELTPQELIRKSLEMLEDASRTHHAGGDVSQYVAIEVVALAQVGAGGNGARDVLGQVLADRTWIPHPGRTIAARIDDDAMAPILPSGSIVAIDDSIRDPMALSGRIVAARIDGRPAVRWLELTGKHVLLRPNRTERESPVIPLEPDGGSETILGQVVWSWSRFAGA